VDHSGAFGSRAPGRLWRGPARSRRFDPQGQIEIIPHTERYLQGTTINLERVFDGWVKKLDSALAAGYEGLRLSGNTFWLEKKDWAAFTDYEAAVNGVISRHRMLAACTYSLDRCGADDILDVISNHASPSSGERGNGKEWRASSS